jgi:hypothetical protein
MGHPEKATPFHEHALEIAGQGNHGILTHIHNSLGSTLRALGLPTKLDDTTRRPTT